MSGAFAADWLALREPADGAARSFRVLDAFAAGLRGRDPVVLVDLACGTGSTLRAVSPRIRARQTWRLVDRDPALLEAAVRAPRPAGVSVEARRMDLAADVEAALALEADAVTLSAFLDLASADWIGRLVAAAARHGRPVYAALSYDGRVGCSPADPLDAAVLAAFDAHQRTDKGLGGALGPAAARHALDAFAAAGFEVASDRADWALGAAHRALQARLIEGWHDAVAETGRLEPGALDGWRARRLAAVADGRSRLVVGHVDLYARPPAAPRSSPTSHSTSSPSR